MKREGKKARYSKLTFCSSLYSHWNIPEPRLHTARTTTTTPRFACSPLTLIHARRRQPVATAKRALPKRPPLSRSESVCIHRRRRRSSPRPSSPFGKLNDFLPLSGFSTLIYAHSLPLHPPPAHPLGAVLSAPDPRRIGLRNYGRLAHFPSRPVCLSSSFVCVCEGAKGRRPRSLPPQEK